MAKRWFFAALLVCTLADVSNCAPEPGRERLYKYTFEQFPHGARPPNIVLLLTDDQDSYLGGTTAMPFTKSFLKYGGAQLTNFFANTPVCCPSRTTLLSGNYAHNWHTTGSPACMHMNVTNTAYQQSMFSSYLRALGYTTGMFGKLLNPEGMTPYCTGDNRQPLPGFDSWLAMCDEEKYFDNLYTTSFRNKNDSNNSSTSASMMLRTGNSSEDYLTSVIGNATLGFAEAALQSHAPFFAYVAPHAPHVPATPAPWYRNEFSGDRAPRTPNYNYSALDHHYMVRSQPPITSSQEAGVDELFRNRLRTLLSVDDIMESLVRLLKEYNQLDNTYFLWTSDHGFHLGQFRLPSCKLQPYEFDIRIPFFIRGPGIPQHSRMDFVAGIVDIAPTLLSLGGGRPLPSMDGKSFAHLLFDGNPAARSNWRDKHMIEYWSLGYVERFDHLVDMPNNTYIGVRLLNSTHNYLYAEYYANENEVSYENPLEYELFDIDADPYQFANLFGTGQHELLVRELHDFIHHQVTCKGQFECK